VEAIGTGGCSNDGGICFSRYIRVELSLLGGSRGAHLELMNKMYANEERDAVVAFGTHGVDVFLSEEIKNSIGCTLTLFSYH